MLRWKPLDAAARRLAGLLLSPTPARPMPSYGEALAIVERCRWTLPPAYRETLCLPLAQYLYRIGAAQYQRLLSHPTASSHLILLEALRLRSGGHGREDMATASAQELISDIYDGFLSAEDRRGFSVPDLVVVPPLIAWERIPRGPAFFERDRLSGVDVGVVAMPITFALDGRWAWPLIAHEVGGHEVLLANRALLPELALRVRHGLDRSGLRELADYWAGRVHEAAADILGVLNIGPVLGLSLVAYLCALHGIGGGPLVPRVVDEGSAPAHYPVDILRAWAVSEAIGALRFTGARAWRARLQDALWPHMRQGVWLEGRWHAPRRAVDSAACLAAEVAQTPLVSLGNRAFEEIQNWYDSDEARSEQLAGWLRSADPRLPPIDPGCYAAHGMAASILAELHADLYAQSHADLYVESHAQLHSGHMRSIAVRTLTLLTAMHRANPVWRGASVVLPGDLGVTPAQK
ncbi:MAG: hypothetical protein AAGF11_12010 [Myxococcota bacterium]